jgi:glycosyltransferase involved in cell wall biosynthesis
MRTERSARVRAVLVGQAPPPTHGQSVVNGLLAEGRYEHVELRFVRMRFSRSIGEIGHFRWRKLVELIRVVAALSAHAARGHRDALVYSVGFGSSHPIARDTIVLLACRPLFRHTILHVHTAGPDLDLAALPRPVQRLVHAAYGDADAVFLVAREVPVPETIITGARRVDVVENGIENGSAMRRLTQPDLASRSSVAGAETVRVLFLANLDPAKGTLDLLDAVADLVARGVEGFVVDVVGPSPSPSMAHQLRARIGELGLDGRVRLLGARHGQQKWAALAAADLFCYPTRADAAPLVVLEALAAGLPVVSTEVGGLPSLVESGVSGTLVPAGDVGALSAALGELVTDDGRRHAMGREAERAFRQRFTAEAMRGRFDEAVRQVVAVPAGGGRTRQRARSSRARLREAGFTATATAP